MNHHHKLLEEIDVAYEATDLMPCQDKFYIDGPDGDCACPLTALAISRGIFQPLDPRLRLSQDEGNPVFIWAKKEFGENWTLGFLDGYDYCQPNEDLKLNLEYFKGYATGLSLAKTYLEVALPAKRRP